MAMNRLFPRFFVKPVVAGFCLAIGKLMLSAPNPAKAQGMIPVPQDTYLEFEAVPKFRAFLPEKVDMSHLFPIPASQGDQGSCTAFAAAYAVRSFYQVHKGDDAFARDHAAFSPSFVYNAIKRDPNDCMSGATIVEALNFLQSNGTVPIELFPYDTNSCVSVADAQLTELAGNFKVDGWSRLDIRTLDDIRGALAKDRPVVFGFYTSSPVETLPWGEIYDDLSEEVDYAHAAVLVGYDERKRAFRFINSWGPDWSEGGYGWISYRAFKKRAFEAYVIKMPANIDKVASILPTTMIDAAPAATPIPETPVVAIPETSTPAPVEPEPEVASLDTQPEEPIIVVPPEDILASRLESLACSGLSYEQKPDGSYLVDGYVSEAQDLKAVWSAFKDLGFQASGAVDVKAWPVCEALQTVENWDGRNTSLVVETNKAEGYYRAGENLVLNITTPGFANHLYTIYLQSSGDAVWLHATDPGSKHTKPGEVFTLGAGVGQPTFEVAAPFGDEIIVVLASENPLFPEQESFVEGDREFLTDLRQVLLQQTPESRIAAQSVSIRTVPK